MYLYSRQYDRSYTIVKIAENREGYKVNLVIRKINWEINTNDLRRIYLINNIRNRIRRRKAETVGDG